MARVQGSAAPPRRKQALLYTGVGVDYAGDVYMSRVRENGGQIHVHVADVNGPDGWKSLTKVQELVPGHGCNAVEWVELHPSGKTLYALCDYWRFNKIRASKLTPGRLLAYQVDQATGLLRTPPDASLLSGGHQPCHATVAPKEDLLAVAHYLCGTVAIWEVDPSTGAVQGAQPLRLLRLPHLECVQPEEDRLLGTHTGPLAHGVTFSPCGRWLLVCDAGQSALCVWSAWSWTRSASREQADEQPVHRRRPVLEGRSRPRQCKFAQDGAGVFVAHEITNQVTLHAFNPENGELLGCTVVGTTLSAWRGWRLNMLAELVLLPDANILAVTNRAVGAGTIAAGIAQKRGWSPCMVGLARLLGSCWNGRDATVALFRMDSLRPMGHLPAGKAEGVGDARHAIELPPSAGGGMLCGLTESGKVLHFKPLRGRYLDLAASVDARAPLCLAVLPPNA